ncbi:unnamed protein product [Somion occarium]|uniref:Phosphatidylinositol-specific phospholipase C X domain-containing protein n=1 Tax=Somion occarium TaxID=3059160 RepID=A0ABP1D6C3_9APHY
MKRLTIHNRTNESVSLDTIVHTFPTERRMTILPGGSTTLPVRRFGAPLTLYRQDVSKDHSLYVKELASPSKIIVHGPMMLGATWRAVEVGKDCPWIIYRSRSSRRQRSLLILPRRNLSAFLRDLPDTLPLSALALPGTHDTMALYGWPISQCQSLATPLVVQLQSGIRILDIRLALKDSRLIAYHGVVAQRVSFQYILSTIHDFLTSPESCHETIVMSIKQEDFAVVRPQEFSQHVHDEVANGPGGMGMWFLENRIPTLGEVRGKVVMFSRFGGNGCEWDGGLEGLGIHPTTWPDSEKFGFTWECKNTLVWTHDWYNIPSFLAIPEKTTLATQILLPSPNNPPVPTLAITFFSAASFPLAFPPTIARGFGWPSIGFGVGVNARLAKWLIDKLAGGENDSEKPYMNPGPRIRGWAFMDFYTDPQDNSVIPLLIECNYRGRIRGEEGWL